MLGGVGGVDVGVDVMCVVVVVVVSVFEICCIFLRFSTYFSENTSM